jgi:hypothetical protein
MLGPANRRRIVVLSLLIAGVGGFVVFFGKPFLTLGPWGAWPLILLALAAACAAWLLPTPRLPLPRSSGLALVVAVAYLFLTAHQQARRLTPTVFDEFSYLVQAHQLAHGRLWMPAHPLAPFFDSFQIFVHPVYASLYFPGTALLYVPGIWLHLPPWMTTLAIAGAVIFLLHRVMADLIDLSAAWLAVLLLVSCQMFRTLSVMTMSQLPLVMCVLLATLAFLKWRSNRRLRWAILLGAAVGLAAITRPVDMICFALPLGIAVAIELRKFDRKVPVLAAIVLSAVPFLTLQLIANRGITGHWLQTPFRLYADADYPGTSFGFHPLDPAARPNSTLAQKQAVYIREVLPDIGRHQPHNLPHILSQRIRLTVSLAAATPFPLLAILLPVALISRRRALFSPLLLFVGLYIFYTFFFPHYTIVAAPVVIAGILIGAAEMSVLHPKIRTAVVLFIAAAAIAALPQLDPTMRDDLFDAPLLRAADAKLAALTDPSIVLFVYNPVRNVDEEPVYNSDVAWPDDAPVIRANDLGLQNPQLFRYFADRQPQRRIYRFNEADYSLTYLGTAQELAYNPK